MKRVKRILALLSCLIVLIAGLAATASAANDYGTRPYDFKIKEDETITLSLSSYTSITFVSSDETIATISDTSFSMSVTNAGVNMRYSATVTPRQPGYVTIRAVTSSGYILASSVLFIEENYHRYQSTVTYPTEKANGYTTFTCRYCGHSYVENYTFPDVRNTAWYYNAVEFAVRKGYFSGNGDGTFGPGNDITRQDFVVVMSRIAKADLSKYNGKTNFTDVPSNAYYAKAIHWATANGIISGYNATKFGVGDKLTREQLVTIFSRYAQKKGVNVTPSAAALNKLNTYSDAAKINPAMKNAVAWALDKKVISGMTSTTVGPQGKATRAQVAAILLNISSYKVIPGI